MSNQRLVPLNVAALASAPAGTPKIGDLYYNTTNLKTWVYSSGGWVVAAGGGAAFQTSAPTGPQVGDIWVDSDAAINLLTPDDYALLSGPTFTGPSTVAVNSASTALTIKQTGAGNAFVVEDSASPDSTPFVVTADGRVGVGAGSPGTMLQVGNGTTNTDITIDGSAPYVGLLLRNRADTASSNSVSYIDTRRTDGSVDASMFFLHQVDGGSSASIHTSPAGTKTSDRRVERLRIDSAGNVGIGTSSPAQRLDVAGEIKASALTSGYANDSLELYSGTAFNTNGDAAISLRGTTTGYNNGGMEFYAGAAERVRIDSAGNVGIGTSSPVERLRVESTAGSANWIVRARNVGIGNDTGIWADASNNMQFAARDSAGNLRVLLQTAGTSYLTGGNVGIGTSSPANFAGFGALTINGTDGSAVSLFMNGAEKARIVGNTDGLRLYTDNTAGAVIERMKINNAGLITGSGTSLGAWTAYTPTLGGTGWAIGNGTIFGVYCQIGKVVHMRVALVFGSTSTFGAGWSTISLPVTAATGIPTTHPCQLIDTSAGVSHFGMLRPDTTTALAIAYQGTNAQMIAVTSTAPFTWASTDGIRAWASYEAA